MSNTNRLSLRKDLIPNQPILDRFPFPFKEDSYKYSNNAAPLESWDPVTITPEYFEEIELKRHLLETVSERIYSSLPHSIDAQWEILEFMMNQLVSFYPDYFRLTRNGDNWTFQNHLLNEEQSFTFGDEQSLPCEPMDFIGRHVQEDLFYLGQRDGELYLDAAQLAFPANWSAAFDLGMDFMDIHNPVPKSFTGTGLAQKVRSFLVRMEPEQPWTRYNWTVTVEPILDTAPENYDVWGSKKEKVTAENAGSLVYLRVEDQRLYRLPQCNGLLFTIHTHLITLDELCKNQQWMNRFYNVLLTLHDDLATYKGFISFKDKIVQYLKQKIEQSSSVL